MMASAGKDSFIDPAVDGKQESRVGLGFEVGMGVLLSLVPRPYPVFQCCTLKNGRAW